MNISYLKKTIGISLIALTVVFAAAGVSSVQNNGYRVRHGNYRTDQQGVDVLRQAVNQGYQQGFQAGQEARSNRRRNNNWRNNSVYRSGDMGYDSHVDRSQYQYYFQQGFQKGYDDGYNSRNRYGSNNTILGSIVDALLRPRRY